MNRFAILATPRSGSNMLCALLNSHPDCVCHHELFNPKGVRLALHLREPAPDLSGLPDRGTRPVAFMQAVMTHWSGRCATGMKMTGVQDHHAFEYLLASTEIRKILLSRRNTLRELVSHKIAERLNQWEVYDAGALIDQRPRIKVGIDELEQRARDNRQHYQNIIERLQSNRQKFLEVSYEDLLGDGRDSTVAGVLDFLGLWQLTGLEATSIRQNPNPLAELLENHDQLRGQLRGTAYRWQLDE